MLPPLRSQLKHPLIAIQKHSLFLCHNNWLFVMGANYSGQLGLGDNNPRNHWVNVNYFASHTIYQISSSDSHSMIVTNQGLFVAGDNDLGQLGLGNNVNRYRWGKVNFFKRHTIYQISISNSHSIVVTNRGVFVTGSNRLGQLGLSNNANRYHKCVATLR